MIVIMMGVLLALLLLEIVATVDSKLMRFLLFSLIWGSLGLAFVMLAGGR